MEASNQFLSFSLIILQFLSWAHGANILFVIGVISSYSHRSGLEPLANKLAERGHNVTFLSPIGPSSSTHPNITDFCPPEMKAINQIVHDEFGVVGLRARLDSASAAAELLQDHGAGFCNLAYEGAKATYNSPVFKEWVERSSFDLVVVDRLSVADAGVTLAYKFGAKTVGYGAVPMIMPWDTFRFGIPLEPWWIPAADVMYDTDEPGLWDRVWSIYSNVMWNKVYTQDYVPRIEKLARETLGLGESMPSLEELVRREGVFLFNAHASDSFAKSLPPHVIPVGGMQLTEVTKDLPKEIENFIQKGKDGFIYISFGSVVRISTVPPSFLQLVSDSFRALPQYQFLMKWEGELPANIPGNALLKPWFPQNDILAHPKIRGFVSQAGQISLQQAIFHGVPIIALPINGDQDANAKRLQIAGNGIDLKLGALTAESLAQAIRRVIEDKSYHRVAEKLQKVSRDRPMSALDTAVWWVEYVLRHEDTEFLKPLAQPWWKLLSFDTIGLIVSLLFGILIATSIILFAALRIIFRIRSGTKPEISERKKRK